MKYIDDDASKALRVAMDHVVSNCITLYRGRHMCLRKMAKLTKKQIRVSRKPLSLSEYVALTETDDVHADYHRFRSHPHSGCITHTCIKLEYPRFLRLWEIDRFFPDTDVTDWMSMFVRLIHDVPFMMAPETETLLPFQVPKFKGLLYVLKLLVDQGFRDWNKTGYFITYRSWNDHFFGLIEQTGYVVPYEIYSTAMNCPICISALIEETGVFTTLDCDEVILRVGFDWTARLIIQHSDDVDLSLKDVLKLFSRDQMMLNQDCITEMQTDIRCIFGQAFTEGLPTIRFLILWALGLLPTDDATLRRILCHKDYMLLTSGPKRPTLPSL